LFCNKNAERNDRWSSIENSCETKKIGTGRSGSCVQNRGGMAKGTQAITGAINKQRRKNATGGEKVPTRRSEGTMLPSKMVNKRLWGFKKARFRGVEKSTEPSSL